MTFDRLDISKIVTMQRTENLDWGKWIWLIILSWIGDYDAEAGSRIGDWPNKGKATWKSSHFLGNDRETVKK